MKKNDCLLNFYHYLYDDFVVTNSVCTKGKLFIFKKIPFLPWSASKGISWVVYGILHAVFAPFLFLDKFFFLKTEYFKNNTNGTSLFLRAIWSTFVLIILFVLIAKIFPGLCSIEILNGETAYKGLRDYALAIGLLFGLYWNARSVFTRKWDYSASLFNKLCFDVPFVKYKDVSTKRIAVHFHQSTLAIDLLVLEIWSHKSFLYCFREALELSVAYKCFAEFYEERGHINKDIILINIKKEIELLYSGKTIHYSYIKKILERYQGDLSDFVVNENVF